MNGLISRPTAPLAHKVGTARILVRARMIRPQRPSRLLHAAAALRRWGTTLAGGTAVAAVRWPDATAVIDDRTALTWQELHQRSNALARALARTGQRPGDTVGILCRNHHEMVEATIAADKIGLTTLYLNTLFAAPQVADVCAREHVSALVYDADLADATRLLPPSIQRFLAWAPAGETRADPRLDALIADADPTELRPPPSPGRIVILTSGTTGGPRGARRRQPSSLDPVASLFDRIPYRARETTLLAAPLFHSWGLLNFGFGLTLGSTTVLARRFEPERVLADVERHRCTALVLVPVMLQRILDLPATVLDRYDVSSLRIIAASGSPLSGELATRALDRFGDVLYNFYGSTEVAWVTIAGPADLRDAPGSAGRPPRGTALRILDGAGAPVPQGRTGRIFVSNEMTFAGYTDGQSREVVAGLMATGDLGHIDADGRLFVDGREDDMVISGGENVFPREVEDLLASHPHVGEVTVVGVPDPAWGQALRAYVVPRGGTAPDEQALRLFVRQRLAAYKVPREVRFLDALPRTATGKVVKRDLPG